MWLYLETELFKKWLRLNKVLGSNFNVIDVLIRRGRHTPEERAQRRGPVRMQRRLPAASQGEGCQEKPHLLGP